MKKLVKAVGCTALVLAAVSMMSCGGEKKPVSASGSSSASGESSSIIPEKTVTLQVYDQLANYSGEQLGWFGQVMLEKFNVKLNIIPESGNTYTTRMESGNLGDIVIWGNDSDDYLGAAEGGMLFDWEEEDLLSNYGSYIKKNMPLALEKNRNISSTGKIYGFGHGVSTTSKDRQGFFYTWDLRFDLYDKLGRPEIKNLDDLHKVLKQMKEICPTDDQGNETYGVSLFPDWDGNMVMYVKSLGTAYVGWDEFGFGLYDPTTGTYHSCLEENGPYLKALKFLNDLYQDGLLDPDSQTQQYDGMSENYVNGTAFWNIFNWMASGSYNTDAHVQSGKAMYPVRPTEASPICYGQSVYGGNRIWSIGAKTEYPELCMAIINWLSTPEGRLTAEYGPQGACWDYDENGGAYLTELGLSCKTDSTTTLTGDYSGTFDDGSFKMNNTTWALDSLNPDSKLSETYNYKNWESYKAIDASEIEKSWIEWSGAQTPDEYIKATDYILAPGTTYSAGTHSDELQVVWDQVTTCIKDYSWKAIYAETDEEFEAIVSEMIQQATDYGYDQCVEFQEGEAQLRKAAEQEALAAN